MCTKNDAKIGVECSLGGVHAGVIAGGRFGCGVGGVLGGLCEVGVGGHGAFGFSASGVMVGCVSV